MKKLIVIIGAMGELGSEVSRKCNEEGIETVALYRNLENANKLAEEIHPNNLFTFYKLDFSNVYGDIEDLMNTIQNYSPDEITIIHTAFVMNPIARIGLLDEKLLWKT